MSISCPHLVLDKFDPTAMYKVAETDTASEHPPSLQDTQSAKDCPLVFAFTETQGGPVTAPVHIRECGTPEFAPFRLSFDPEPIWLNQPKGDFDGEMFEVKDGFSLTSFWNKCVTSCFIHLWSHTHLVFSKYEIDYLQLPIGVAKPYITEV